ncbi:hypothetical protein [Aliagarivorans marinus]|uniref:hypothetical protein n=1 Tax=Aliagarivorans marinus TaxID=561965 RepID=UPI0003F77A6F|nr:hypothetical protein [Aliagarivorans marinus]
MKIDSNAATLYSEATPKQLPKKLSYDTAIEPQHQCSGDTLKRIDFSHTTSKALMDWVDEQVAEGHMALPLRQHFADMTLQIPVTSRNNEMQWLDDDSNCLNFIERAETAIEAARSSGDSQTRQHLEQALEVMHRHQGMAIGIDAHA